MFLVFCGLTSLTGVCVVSSHSVSRAKITNLLPCKRHRVEAQPEQAEVLRYSCAAALQLGVKVTSSDCLSITFCSKPGHSYRWGGRFGMCTCALYLKRKEKNRENDTSVMVYESSTINWSTAKMRLFALACHTYETLFYFLDGNAFLFFFSLLLPPHFGTASYSQLKSETCILRMSVLSICLKMSSPAIEKNTSLLFLYLKDRKSVV